MNSICEKEVKKQRYQKRQRNETDEKKNKKMNTRKNQNAKWEWENKKGTELLLIKKSITGHTKTNEIHKFMPQRDESSHVFGRHQTT